MHEKKTYSVTYQVRGYATALVEAESEEEALRMVAENSDGELSLDDCEVYVTPLMDEA